MERTRAFWVAIVVAAGMVVAGASGAAETPTPDDFALRILPADVVLPASPDAPVPVELEVTVSSAVEGVQGWSYGILLENNGLTTFFIENAQEHPDLQQINGDRIPGYGLVPGRPAFHAINYFTEDTLNVVDPVNRGARAPNQFNNGDIPHDTIDGVPGEWAAVAEGVIFDMEVVTTLPMKENFGATVLTVQVQGEPPNSGKVVFTDTVGNPPIAIVIVWNGQSFTPPAKDAGEDVDISPAVQDPSTISFGGGSALFVRGDPNGDGSVDISDPVSVLFYLFGSGPAPGCLKAADGDDDGQITIGDASYLLTYLFSSGSEPPEPFGGCGADSTPDDLSCNTYAPCN